MKDRFFFVHQIQYEVQYLSETEAEADRRPEACASGDWEEDGRVCRGERNRGGCPFPDFPALIGDSCGPEGTPLRPAIMWLDKRNASICEELKDREAWIVSKTGARVNAIFSGSKMTWNQEEGNRKIMRKAGKLITIADYLAWLMTGEYKTDHTYEAGPAL